MGVFFMLLGIAVIALGLFAVKNPDSWWFRRIGDDSEPSDDDLECNRLRGAATMIVGIVVTVLSIQHFLV